MPLLMPMPMPMLMQMLPPPPPPLLLPRMTPMLIRLRLHPLRLHQVPRTTHPSSESSQYLVRSVSIFFGIIARTLAALGFLDNSGINVYGRAWDYVHYVYVVKRPYASAINIR
jgi:hypothetical protein